MKPSVGAHTPTMPIETLTYLYYARARFYNFRLGRFMQPDPIGYEDGMNLYAYVRNDPVNLIDPWGLQTKDNSDKPQTIVVTGSRGAGGGSGGRSSRGGFSNSAGAALLRTRRSVEAGLQPAVESVQEAAEIVVTGYRLAKRTRKFGLAVRDWGIAAVRHITLPMFFDEPEFPSFCGCFAAGTMISTSAGLRPIEDIKIGDLVLAVNEQTGEIAPKPVTDLIRPEPKPLYALKALDAGGEAETFHATDDHPWKVEGKGWVETVDLKEGDRIDTGSGADLVVTSLTLTERVERTYNLTVADWHTFMVGEDQAVVHNVDCREVAARLGFKRDRSRGRWHGQPVFRKGNRLISPDIDGHKGGYWKVYDVRGNRLGTWNENLTDKIGK